MTSHIVIGEFEFFANSIIIYFNQAVFSVPCSICRAYAGHITVKDFDKSGNIIFSDGQTLTTSKFSYGYAATSHKFQGTTCHSVIIGFDRHSIQHADRKIAYVAGTRGTEQIKIFCENKLELWDIEKRKGDRKSVMEMLEKENPREKQSKKKSYK